MKNQEIILSKAFKKQTIIAIFSIFLFLLVYLSLFALAVVLTLACFYFAFQLVVISPGFLTLLLGFGLISFGVLILIFLIKFLFTRHKTDRSNLVEINRKDEPKLFELIDDVVQEVATDFPKKVYLSNNVNAAVFYDSSFWSMFLPIKKNLLIGVGLVNTVTVEEFKAILAHEFGHFSQRTMKVGSYVYNMNQVIYNLLYDNDSYHALIQKFANIHSLIYYFVILAIKLVDGIKWILKKMYDFMNINYMALSREMEFHADEIAAHITGYEPLKNALLRLNLSEHAFNSVINFYEEKYESGTVSENLYKEQSFVMALMAKDANIPIFNNLPNITLELINRYNKSKLVIANQWASHPSIDDRIERLEKTNLLGERSDEQIANVLFSNIDQTQKQITKKIFEKHTSEKQVTQLALPDFQSEFETNFKQNAFPKIYNGYYDVKNPTFFELPQSVDDQNLKTLEVLFSDEIVAQINQMVTFQSDMETIKQIENGNLEIRTFDYDGKKYNKNQCFALLQTLNVDMEELQAQFVKNDEEIYRFFSSLERPNTGILRKKQEDYFAFLNVFEDKISVYYKMSENLAFINYTTPIEQIHNNFSLIKPEETKLKDLILELIESCGDMPEFTPQLRKDFESYLSQSWIYFAGNNYINENLDILYKAMNGFGYLLSRRFFFLKKDLLDYQVSLLQPNA
ncbi:MAG: M48 family metalloprotease [Saprospiraceae bacterium]|nr:M48 family metalloprotease [Saprospiraceae bacterium]